MGSRPVSAALQGYRRRLVEVASERGGAWVPELGSGPVEATIVREHHRVGATVAVLELTGSQGSSLVASKTTWPTAEPTGHAVAVEPRRPRVVERLDRAALPAVQHRGLQLIHQHFSRLGDPRFGAIRPLDVIPELKTVVMEHWPWPTLRSRLDRAIVAGPAGQRTLLAQLANAGAWLREYHAFRAGSSLPVRTHTRSAFMTAAAAFVDFLGERTGDDRFFGSLERDIHRTATLLPPQLALGLTHGDYAPRNVFVGPGERVTGFDALPRAHGAVLEDVARFLIAIRTGGLHLVLARRSLGAGRFDRYEQSFLRGYFGEEPPPMPQIRVFETLVLLNRWSAVVDWESPSLRRRVRARVRETVYGRRFRSELARVLRWLDRTVGA